MNTMQQVVMCLNMPHGGAYIGGIAAVVNGYLEARDQFERLGYSLHLFDYQNEEKGKLTSFLPSSISYGIKQIPAAKEYVHKHQVDVFHVHTSRSSLFFKDLLLLRSIKKCGVNQIVLSIHVGLAETVFRKIPRVLIQYSIKLINQYVDKVIFLSEKIREQFIAYGVQPEKTEILYNYYDIPIAATNSCKKITLNKTNNCLRLLYMGMINRDKGTLDLLTALENTKDIPFTLDVCGIITDESIRKEFEQHCTNLGNRINLHGYVKGKKKSELFQSADILLLPSYHEGLPLVVLEALASGCGIIATQVGALPEILSEGNVCWVSAGATDEIEQRVRFLYSNPEILKCMKDENRKRSKQFSKANHIEKLCSIYDKGRVEE